MCLKFNVILNWQVFPFNKEKRTRKEKKEFQKLRLEKQMPRAGNMENSNIFRLQGITLFEKQIKYSSSKKKIPVH